ncbi:MAG TPA: tetratricopeptide repeat protein, partial [Pirellulaceae bacterium]|nr:tetratricopeptide repeat protein [Pirellulaceae bacterium]
MSDEQPVPSETDEVVAFLAGKVDGESRHRLARRAGESGDDIATAVDWLVSRSQSLARVTIGGDAASHDSNVDQVAQEESLPTDSPNASLDVRDAAAVEGRASVATGSPGTEVGRTSWRRSWPLPAAALVLAIAVIAGFALRSTAPPRREPFEVWPQSVATRGHDGGAVPTIGSDGEFRIHGREMSLVIRSPIDGVATILMVSGDRVQVVPNPSQPAIDVQAEVARSYAPLAAPTSRSVVVVVVAPRRVDDELRDLKPAAPQGASTKKSVSAQVRERLVRGGHARFEIASIELAPAERAGAADSLDEVVDERFVEESSYSSLVSGPARKTSGVLFLSGGSSVELPVRAGLNVDVDLAFTSADAGAERPSVTQIGLRTENGSDYAVAMLLANSQAAPECQLFFLDLSPGPDGKPDPTMLAGRFSVPIESLDGAWALRWRFGHVELWRGQTRVAQQYFHALAHPITSVRVTQVRGTVGLGRLRIAASPAPDPWGPDERRQWDLAEAAESRLHQHWSQGRSQEARTEGEEVLRLRAAVAGIEHPDVALAYLNLATMLFRMGEYRESRDSAEAALGSFAKHLGSGHPLTSLAHERVGEACRELGDFAAAEPHFSESLHWRLRALGAAHPQVADSHTNIGQLALAKGDTSRARSEFERSWEIRRESAGEESPSAAHGLNDLGMVLLMQGDFVAATEMLTAALAIRQRTLPKDHYEISLSLNNLALAWRESGELDLARELWEEAVCRLEGAFPPDHPWMLSLAENLAVAEAQHESWLSARKRFENAAALSRQRYGECGRTARLQFHLAHALHSLGETGRAREEWQAAEAWAEKAVSSNDRLALHILFDRGLRLKRDGDEAGARVKFHSLLERHLDLSLGTLATLSEAEMFAFVTLSNRRRDQYLWLLRSQREQNAADAYEAVWQTKAVATRMLGVRKV